jgi:hypothetical protein
MKTLIEQSIEIYGMGHPDVKTIFNIKDETEKLNPRFTPLSAISGRLLTIWFKYTENNLTTEDKLRMQIPFNLNDDEVKDFILTNLNSHLAQ